MDKTKGKKSQIHIFEKFSCRAQEEEEAAASHKDDRKKAIKLLNGS